MIRKKLQKEKNKESITMEFDPLDFLESETAVYGIVGDPVKHSLSPYMHNAAFKALEVDAEYRLFPLKKGELKRFFEDLKDEQSPIFGFNVTVPHKEEVLEYMDRLDPFADKVQAVNTVVVNHQRKLIGYNTDGPGFLAHLKELKFNLHEKRISILGAGGTTRALLATLCMIPERPQSIRIYNRTFPKLESLINDLSSRIDLDIVEPVHSVDDLNIELADMLINTTSLGLDEHDPCLVDEEALHSNLLVYDVIYNPNGTPLLNNAKKKGSKIANGLGMLFYQGVLSFQHWAELEASDELKNIMREALERGYNEA